MTRNYITSDFATKLERARRKMQRMPQPHRPLPPSVPAPQVSGMFRVYNNGSEKIPESGVMQVEDLSERTGFGGDQQEAYAVVKPGEGGDNNDELGTMFLINAGGEIEQDRWGAGIFLHEPNKVLIDPAANPAFLDSFGPVDGKWYLGPSGIGYLWLGLTDEDNDTAIFKEGLPPDGVLFRNDATEAMPAYGVGRITGDEDVNGNSVTKVAKPDTTFSRLYLVNGGKEIAVSKYGIGYLMDGKKRRVLYDSGTPAFGEGWGPKPSQWSIASGYYGFTIYGDSDTAALTTMATAKPINIVTAKTSAAHAKAATQSVNVFTGDAATDTTWDISAKNAYCALATTKECEVSFIGNVYKLIAGDPST